MRWQMSLVQMAPRMSPARSAGSSLIWQNPKSTPRRLPQRHLRLLIASLLQSRFGVFFIFLQFFSALAAVLIELVANNHPPAKPGVFKIVSRSKRLDGVANAAPTLGATETVATYLHSPSCSNLSSSFSWF